MGWTLFACFGGTNKRKRPKSASKCSSKTRRRIRGYEPLQSDIAKELDASQALGSTREKNPKDEMKTRIRKRVRFNLEVVTYEPLSSQEDEHDNHLEEGDNEETDRAATALEAACLIYAPESKLSLYSSNYRYNCFYDGEDEYEEVDDDDQITDDEEDDDNNIDDDYEDDDDGSIIVPQSRYNEKVTEEHRDCSSVPLISSSTNARLRSHYVVPVLNPIENLSQWKTVKTRKC